jgi:serine/threonine protein phosphatase PrpC
MYIQKKASRVGKNPSAAFGSYGGGQMDGTESSLRWEIGAVSECGIRESNEDAYLIANDLLTAFESGSFGASSQTSWQPKNTAHALGLFAIFDGHCGNETARFAVERLCHFIHDELLRDFHGSKDCCDTPFNPAVVESILHDAIIKMDDEFCHLCQEDDRDWESGATALVAMLVNENLVIANLGDCRGVLCRLVDDTGLYEQDEQWCKLENLGESIYLSDRPSSTNDHSQKCFWREVTQTHTPALDNERERIEGANGWITTETEIPIGQLRRMDFHDEDVIEILKRCLHHPAGSDIKTISENERSTKECKAAPQRILHISRVCGELAVSRALGDRDFKAAFNSSFIPKNQRDPICFEREQGSDNKLGWQCPLYLPYPDDHSRRFKGDLVSNKPEFQRIKVGESGVSDEFLLLACDGLWDVMDTDDAVRIVRDLLFRKNWTAKKAAARLAELAIHLGSSDNVTVILIRIFPRGAKI